MKTRERQYQFQITHEKKLGRVKLGLMTSAAWYQDPRRLLFLFARYKFVAKMLNGKKRVLEVGCGDALGTRLVQQEGCTVSAIDFDPVFVRDVNERMDERWKFECKKYDILAAPYRGRFDAAYSLDVIEHIDKAQEDRFVSNITASLTDDGVLIIGSPSLQSQAYASPASKEGHVNCKDAKELKGLLQGYFQNVFVFSMNDEVVHTGYYPMAHYLFALCCGKRKRRAGARGGKR